MRVVPLLARLFSVATWPDAVRHARGLAHVARAEDKMVARLTRELKETRYGRSLGLDDDGARFFSRVPIVTYRELEPLVLEQMATGDAVVTPAPTRLYERTSGSSGVKKYIPYSALLRRTFARMFRTWAHDVVAHGPRFVTGRFYFSISPSFDDAPGDAVDAEIGIADDTTYMDGFVRRALSPFFVAPTHLASERDPLRFKDESAVALLLADELEIVSVWSPTFFTMLLDHIVAHHDLLLAQIEQGERERGRRRRARRLDALRIAFTEHGSRSTLMSALWPHLKLISCWRGGHAEQPALRLAELFPRALVQGKGLLATEGPVTIPLVREPGEACAPLVDDVLIEVILPSGDVTRLSGLREGDEGEVVISPSGGFARYRLGDRVRVTHGARGEPRLTFLGRADRVSDLVGEKLDESFVERTLAELFAGAHLKTLVPTLDVLASPPARYALFIDDPALADDALAAAAAARLDRALSGAFHYAHARALSQLAPPVVIAGPRAREALLDAWTKSGRRPGDMKPCALVTVPLPVIG